MEIGLIGLGKMGLNMSLRLLRGGHHIIGFDLDDAPAARLEQEGGVFIQDLSELRDRLASPRAVWVMLPAGEITENVVGQLLDVLDEGDLIIEGANSRYTDTLRLAATVHERGLHYVDAGVSGGIWGLENGYSLMVGGSDEAVSRVEPVLKTLAPAEDQGWGHVGPVGSGHFVKMVHNGIEYGLMQAYAEGFALLDAKNEMGEADDVDLDLHQIAEIWRTGSVIQSWLLDLAAEALDARPKLDGIAPYVPDSGEGRWTVEEAIALRVPAPVIAAALFERFQSRAADELPSGAFSYKLLSALRGGFGGHPVKGTPGADGLNDDGTIDVIPGGPQTEGATTRHD